MGIGKKYDYPPLLAPGRHTMTLAEVEAVCVTRFQNNQRRRHLFHRLEEFIQAFLVAGVACEVWIDGSLLTEKPEPDDLDVTVILEPDVSEMLTNDQQQLVDQAAECGFGHDIDNFAFVKFRREHPSFGDENLDPAYSWGHQYGLECSEEWLKGFIVLRLRETHVGLRICR
jgi:Family of unknown function (DUF6932)